MIRGGGAKGPPISSPTAIPAEATASTSTADSIFEGMVRLLHAWYTCHSSYSVPSMVLQVFILQYPRWYCIIWDLRYGLEESECDAHVNIMTKKIQNTIIIKKIQNTIKTKKQNTVKSGKICRFVGTKDSLTTKSLFECNSRKYQQYKGCIFSKNNVIQWIHAHSFLLNVT